MPLSRDLLKPFARIPVLLAILTLLWMLALLLAPIAHAQNFAQPKVIPTGNWPTATYTADINNDGYPDLIYIDQGATPQASTTHILLNNSHGNFTPSATLATAGTSLAIADMNGTGHLDIVWVAATPPSGVVLSNAYTAIIAAGKGDGTFAAPTTFGAIQLAPFNPPLNTFVFNYLVAGHFYHQTGRLDLAFQELSQKELCTFVGPTIYDGGCIGIPTGTGPMLLADLNSDGYQDLVFQQDNAQAAVSLGGPGFYSVPPVTSTFTGLTGVHSLLVQDVNYDGIPDLIAEGAAGHIDVFPGNGDGTFQSTSIGGTGPLDGTTGNGGHLIVAADLNNDGLLDALAATPAGISTLLGNGTQYLGLKAISNAGPTGANGHPSYVTADFNHDGFLDLAVDSPEGIAILFGLGDGTFQTSQAFAAGQPAMSSALGAFTASGHLDAVVSTAAQQAQFLRGNGDGTFTYTGSPGAPLPTTTQTGPPGLWSVVQAGDFNGDGHLDLALTADGSRANLPTTVTGTGIVIQPGLGDGTFQTPIPLPATPFTTCPGNPSFLYGTSSVAQFGGNGLASLANRDWIAVRVYLGTQASSTPLGLTSEYQTGCALHAHNLIGSADFNNDGLPDLLFQQDGQLREELNSGGGYMLGHADLSVDGSLTTSGQLTAPDISPTFGGNSATFSQPYFPGSIATADLDRDGNTDLLVTYANLAADRTAPTPAAPNYLYIWYGTGGGKFLTSAAHPVNPVRMTLSRNYYQVAVADLNRDGIPDLILSDGYLLSVQLGLGDGTFGPETHYLAGEGINTVSIGDVNGDTVPDLVLANGGAVLTNPVANLETLATNPDVNTGGITVLLNHAQPPPALASTSLSLRLCVDDPGSLYPCGNPLDNTPLVSPVTMFYGQVLDGVAIESATNLTGTITFYDGTRVFCTIPANLTGAGPMGNACPTNAGNFHAGSRTVDAVYSGDSANAPSTSNSIAVQVFPDITTSAIASSLNPAPVATPVTFIATLTGNFATPTGTVTFFDGLTQIGTATLDANGHATFTTSTLAVGSHPITVSYSGTPDFNPAPIALLTQIISPGPVTATLTAAPEPSTVGAAFTLIATLAPPAGSANPLPTGSVTFSVDGTVLGQSFLSVGVAAYPGPLTLSVGTHALLASYSGDSNYAPLSNITGSHAVILSPTTTILVPIGPTTIYFNQPANSSYRTLVANSITHPATGTVTVQDNGVSIPYCTAIPYGSTCPYAAGGTNRLTVGTHSLVVLYNGDSYNAPSASAPLVFNVLPGTTAITLTSSLNPAPLGSPVTFTAALSGTPVLPTGSVNFIDGTTILTTVPLDANGNATFTTGTLTLGTHPITVAYAGNTNFAPATSAVLNQVINNPPGTFTLTVTPSPVTIAVGRTGLLLVTVTGNGTFAQAVALTCSTTTPETSCDFILPTIPTGGGSTTFELHTSAPHACGDPEHPYFVGSCTTPPPSRSGHFNPALTPRAATLLLPTLLLLGIATTRARRRLRAVSLTLLLTLSLAGLATLSGCGHCTDLGTPGGRYTFTITATAQGGPVSETQSQVFPLTITIP